MVAIREEEIFEKKSKSDLIKDQLRRSFAIAKKDLRIYYDKGPVVIQGILFPIVLFFAFTIGRKIQNIYIISGLMAMVLFLTATSIGPVVFPWETRQKTLERLIASPISIETILLGNVWSSFTFGCIFSAFPLILGITIFSLWGVANFLLLIPGILISGFAFSCSSLLLSVPPTDMPQNTMILTVVIKFPLIFISPLFMPISESPLAFISPLTYFVDIINVGLGLESAFGALGLLLDFGVLALFGVGILFIATKLHQKTIQKRF